MTETKKAKRTTAFTIRSLHGDDFYARIGRIGGQRGKTGGFASKKVGADGLTGKERARKVGVTGGQASRPYSRMGRKEAA